MRFGLNCFRVARLRYYRLPSLMAIARSIKHCVLASHKCVGHSRRFTTTTPAGHNHSHWVYMPSSSRYILLVVHSSARALHTRDDYADYAQRRRPRYVLTRLVPSLRTHLSAQ
jgi:hypothetical protein